MKGIPEFLDSGRKSRTLDSGRWTLDAGLWTLDSGIWTVNSGRWTLDSGHWTLEAGRYTMTTLWRQTATVESLVRFPDKSNIFSLIATKLACKNDGGGGSRGYVQVTSADFCRMRGIGQNGLPPIVNIMQIAHGLFTSPQGLTSGFSFYSHFAHSLLLCLPLHSHLVFVWFSLLFSFLSSNVTTFSVHAAS